MNHASDDSRDTFHAVRSDEVEASDVRTLTTEVPEDPWQAPIGSVPEPSATAPRQTFAGAGSTEARGRGAHRSAASNIRWRDQVILDTLRGLFRHKILCVLVIGIAGLVGGGATMFMTPFYIAQSKIYPPMNENPLGGFGIPGMAGLLGNLGASSGGSSQFPLYEQVLYGRDLLTKLLRSPMDSAGVDGTVLSHLGIVENDTTLRDAIAISVLREKLTYDADTKTAVAVVAARDSDPRAAAFLVNRAVELLNEFDVSTSTAHAGERRQFIEGRLLGASGTLADSEARLAKFHAQNVRINAAHLILEEARLRREVEIEQQIYLTLRKEVELARIEEHRSIPVVNVLERATPPLAPSGPLLVKNAIFAAFLATAFVVVFFAIRAAQPMQILSSMGLIQPRR